MRTIPQIRAALSWSQEQMAQVLGCSQPTIDRIEGGQPPRGTTLRLAERLDLLLDEGRLVPAMPVADAIRLLVGRGDPASSRCVPSPQLQPQSA